MSKQYGLILPKKPGSRTAPVFTANKNVFGDDSDSDDNKKVTKIPVNSGEKLKRQAQVVQEKVLEEDPTAYQYDELYDDMDDKRKQSKSSVKAEEKKPKYIEKLLQTAEKRKKDNERRVERQVQKEREAEGDKFADKESFVTSSYKKKLEEMKLEEEKEKREQYLEEIGDVTKQADLDGFYRHLYEQQLRPEKKRPDMHDIQKPSETKPDDKSEESPKTPEKKSDAENDNNEKSQDKVKEKRTYRKRKSSGGDNKSEHESENDDEVNRKAISDYKTGKKMKTQEQSNIDADSDFSIDESSSESEDEEGKPKKDKQNKKDKKAKSSKDKKVESSKDKKDEETDAVVKAEPIEKDSQDESEFKKPDDKNLTTEVKDKKSKKENEQPAQEVKPKIDIWKKRTVGEAFDQALQRYYQRKASRGY